jgi:DNA polymerase-3 subunit gamma/tau
MFMFASTEPSGFPPAILSRLQRFDVRRLTVPEIEGKLGRILEADGRAADPAAIHLIARLAAGGMRDAESMLDQLLSAAPERIEESTVRDLLGLADAEVVTAFIDHLVARDGAAGVALLDSLEERGRDTRALLDQAVEAIRGELIAGLDDSGPRRHDPAALAAAGRRLAAIDPNRAGIGGLRFQLELAMFAVDARPAHISEPAPAPPRSEAAPARPDPAPPTTPRPPATRPAPSAQDASNVDARPSAPATTAPGEPVTTAPAAASTTVHAEPVPEVTPEAVPETAREAGPAPRTREPAADPAPASKTGPEPIPVMAAPSAPSAPSSAASSDLDRLLAAWPTIVTNLSAHPPTKPLIVACRPVAVDGPIVTLGFPEEQAFLKDAAERRRTAIEAGISSVLGHPVSVRCVVANVEIPTAGPDDLVAEARRIFADELADVGEIS